MKRTRTNTEIVSTVTRTASSPVLMVYFPNGKMVTQLTDPQWGSNTTAVTEGKTSVITDVVGSSKFGDKPVVHEKYHYTWLNPCPFRWPGSGLDPNSGYSQAGYPCYYGAQNLCIEFNAFGTQRSSPPGLNITWPAKEPDYGDLLQKAYRPVADLLVNLVEADEVPRAIATLGGAEIFSAFKRLWSDRSRRTGKFWFRSLFPDLIVKRVVSSKRLRLVLGFLRESATDIVRSYARPIGAILKEGTKGIASTHLGLIFGILPLIRDIAAVIKYGDRAQRDFDKYSSETRRQASIVQLGDCSLASHIATSYSPGVGSKWRTSLDTAVCERRLHISYNEPALSTAAGRRADLLLRRFTSSGFASTMWELAPLSFVVDWFLDLGNFLLVLDEALGRPKIAVRSATVSETVKASVTAHHTCVYAMTETGQQITAYDTPWLTYAVSRYARRPLSRDFTLVKFDSRFGKSELVTSMSLLAQRLIR